MATVRLIVYSLYIANKNYSSWSLRVWALMSELGIAFTEQSLRFGDAPSWERFRRISPSGLVPCLVDGKAAIWDTLAISEYLAERHRAVWPTDAMARAWARCAAAEMHSGFTALRSHCSMSCGVRIALKEFPPALERDLGRLSQLWSDGLRRFGGPFLAGADFSAVNAFFTPVAFRVQSYQLPLEAACAGYVQRLLALGSMQRWYKAALQENFRDEPHEREMQQFGRVLQDFRQ